MVMDDSATRGKAITVGRFRKRSGRPRERLGILLGGLAVGAAIWGARLASRERRSFRGSVVLVTGGSRGLGLMIARQLAAEGAKLVLCARDEHELEQAGREVAAVGTEVLILPCDISQPDQVRELMTTIEKRHGRLDVLINNAGIMQVAPMGSLSDFDFRRAMDVNFWGMYHCSREALPLLEAAKQQVEAGERQVLTGRIVNITSIGAEVVFPHLLPYACAKFAARAFSEGLSVELARAGIRVTTVLPGLMRTGSFLHALFKGKARREFQWFALSASLPGLSMSASRAARRIVEAARQGEAFVTVGMAASALRAFHALFPKTTLATLRTVSRVLPRDPLPGEGEEVARPGYSLFPGGSRPRRPESFENSIHVIDWGA